MSTNYTVKPLNDLDMNVLSAATGINHDILCLLKQLKFDYIETDDASSDFFTVHTLNTFRYSKELLQDPKAFKELLKTEKLQLVEDIDKILKVLD